MQEFRCSNCNKLLALVDGRAEIKCPRCKVLNVTVLKTTQIGDGFYIVDETPINTWIKPKGESQR